MDKDELAKVIADATRDIPVPPGIDWGMAMAVFIMREMEAREPGFRAAIKARAIESAEKMEASGDPEQIANAPSVRELAASWVFED